MVQNRINDCAHPIYPTLLVMHDFLVRNGVKFLDYRHRKRTIFDALGPEMLRDIFSGISTAVLSREIILGPRDRLCTRRIKKRERPPRPAGTQTHFSRATQTRLATKPRSPAISLEAIQDNTEHPKIRSVDHERRLMHTFTSYLITRRPSRIHFCVGFCASISVPLEPTGDS
jgi:hypothetical protein